MSGSRVIEVAIGVIVGGLLLYYLAAFPFIREARAGFGAA